MKLICKNSLLSKLCLLTIIASSALANDSAIVIFDGSGSMWGKIDKKPKIEIARGVMDALIQDWNEDIDLGLMVYGHRNKGDCNDIEMLVPMDSPELSQLLTAIDDIYPKGKTPISESLKQAADKLNLIESPATVILISDGEESCGGDPCAVAKELKTKDIDFKAHVIGFDVSSEKERIAEDQLKCIADSTGGKYFAAKNATEFKKALTETALVVSNSVTTQQPEIAEEKQSTGNAPTVTTVDSMSTTADLSGEIGASLYFSFDVPVGSSTMVLKLLRGVGDANLWWKHGSLPKLFSGGYRDPRNIFDNRSYGLGNELITVSNPQPGTHYVMVEGEEAFANTTLIIQVD